MAHQISNLTRSQTLLDLLAAPCGFPCKVTWAHEPGEQIRCYIATHDGRSLGAAFGDTHDLALEAAFREVIRRKREGIECSEQGLAKQKADVAKLEEALK